jgi:hypothetical protein
MRTNQIQFPTVAGLGGVCCATCTSQVQSPTVAARRGRLHDSNSSSNCCWPGRGGLCLVHKSSPEANGCCLDEPSAQIKLNFQLLLTWTGWAVPSAQVKSRVQPLLLGSDMRTNQVQFQLLLTWAGWAVPSAYVKSRVRRLLLGGAMHTNQIKFSAVAGLGGVGCAHCTSQVQSPTVAARMSHAHESNSISNCCWPGRGGLCHVHKPSPESNGRCLGEPSA